MTNWPHIPFPLLVLLLSGLVLAGDSWLGLMFLLVPLLPLGLPGLYPGALTAVARGYLCLGLAGNASCMCYRLGLPKSTLGP